MKVMHVGSMIILACALTTVGSKSMSGDDKFTDDPSLPSCAHLPFAPWIAVSFRHGCVKARHIVG
jgi:hypothetical protein